MEIKEGSSKEYFSKVYREAYRNVLWREEAQGQEPPEFITIKELFRERTMDKVRRALPELTIAAEGGMVGFALSAFGVVSFGVQGGSLEAKLLLVGGILAGVSLPTLFRQPHSKFIG